MLSHDDLEGYLRRLDRRFDRLEDDTFLVAVGPSQAPVALRLAPPVLVAQVDIATLRADQAAHHPAVFRRLLELNASELLHAAYGLDGEAIVLSSALELNNLDLNELEAVLADVDMALANHVPVLHQIVNQSA